MTNQINCGYMKMSSKIVRKISEHAFVFKFIQFNLFKRLKSNDLCL